MADLSIYLIVAHLIGVVTVVVYGAVAVWAVGSRWHWFLRTAVVGAALAALWVIGAKEWAIQWGIAAAFFVAGLSIWRRFRERRSSVNKEGALPQSAWP